MARLALKIEATFAQLRNNYGMIVPSSPASLEQPRQEPQASRPSPAFRLQNLPSPTQEEKFAAIDSAYTPAPGLTGAQEGASEGA